MADKDWRNGVKVRRASEVTEERTANGGRATVCDFAGPGEGGAGGKTWVGSVTLPPGKKTGGHTHGRQELTIYVVRGGLEIRWGERLEFAADLAPGDFAYFEAFVPHQEFNRHEADECELVVVRTDDERIFNPQAMDEAETPERVG